MRLGSGPVLEPTPIDEVILVAMGLTAGAYLARQFGERVAGPPVWTINNACFGVRADLCFDMHTADVLAGNDPYWMSNKVVDPDGTRFLPGTLVNLTKEYKKACPKVVTLDGHDETYEYPMAEIIEEFQDNYFTTGPAYMIAYALLCKAKTIHFFGFDWVYGDTQLEPGRPCVEYWMGVAKERGVNFCLPNETTLRGIFEMTKKGLYGYGYTQPKFELIDGKMRLVGYDRGSNEVPRGPRQADNGRRDFEGSLRGN